MKPRTSRISTDQGKGDLHSIVPPARENDDNPGGSPPPLGGPASVRAVDDTEVVPPQGGRVGFRP